MIKFKTSPKKGLPWLCVMFAICLFSVGLSAQQYPELVTDQSAQTMLEAEIPNLIANLDNQTVGTPAYVLAERTFQMYQHTWEYLENGKQLSEALDNSFTEFSSSQISEGQTPEPGKNGHQYDDDAFTSLINFLSL